jgi:hypothetical protein
MATSPRDAIRQTRPPTERATQTPQGSEGTRRRTHHERFAPETQGRDPSDRPRPAERGGQTDSRPSAAAEDSHGGRSSMRRQWSRGIPPRRQTAREGSLPSTGPARFQDRGVGNEMRGRRPDPGASGKGLAGIRTVGAGPVLGDGRAWWWQANHSRGLSVTQTNADHSRLSCGLLVHRGCRVLEFNVKLDTAEMYLSIWTLTTLNVSRCSQQLPTGILLAVIQ